MGKTAFGGPVYGAKGNLFSFGPSDRSAGSTALIFTTVVPAYETWYLTELHAANTLASSNSATPKVVLKVDGSPTADPAFPTGNAGTAATITSAASSGVAMNLMATCTVTAGEFEGYAAPANSTIRVVSSGTIGQLCVAVTGFKRFIDSTRVAQ